MSTRDVELAAAYDAARSHLCRVAYAVLGSRVEAEDVVADCWLRLPAADARAPVHDVTGWATVVVARAALDRLRSAQRRREVYPGEWLPEPIVEPAADPGPADRVTLDESVGYALMVALETLTPAERVAWVLHDLFGLRFDDIATTVGRSPAAVRQLASRARAHVADRAPRVRVDPQEHATVLARFLEAAVGGSLADLVTVLDPDVVLTSDGGGVVSATRRPVLGADRVARFVRGIVAQAVDGDRMDVVLVNGDPGVAVVRDGVVVTVVSLTVGDGAVRRVDIVRAPDKLPT